jgi:16S rRNA processing protein RimM
MGPSQKWVPLGKILREWGVCGQVKCLAFNPESSLFFQSPTLYLETGEGYRPFQVEEVRPHDQYWRIKFRGIESPEAAKLFRGREIALPREELPEVEEGEIYLDDLVGFEVLGPQEKNLGKVLAWETVGSSEVFSVGKDIKSAKLIPYREEFVEKTDKKNKKIFLTLLAMELLKV